jgi:hypothetical protein
VNILIVYHFAICGKGDDAIKALAISIVVKFVIDKVLFQVLLGLKFAVISFILGY